jgi:hypothetical protein
MTESRDPKTCPSCKTVNPWLNEQCRGCGADLADIKTVESLRQGLETGTDEHIPVHDFSPKFAGSLDEETAVERDESRDARVAKKPPRKRWNILWIVIGILLYLAVWAVGEIVILKWIVAPDAELKAAMEEVASQKDPKSLSEKRRNEIKALLFSNVKFVGATVMILIATPILIGGVVGFFSNGILEGAAAMGLAAVFVLFQAGQAAYALAAGPIYAILGWVGALSGRMISSKIRSGK